MIANIATIARHELRRIFVSPLAWSVLAVTQLIFGWIFAGAIAQFLSVNSMGPQSSGVSDFIGAALYGTAAIVLLLVMPLMTMRLFSEERKGQTLTLLFSAPVRLSEIVLGKFVGLLGFVLAVMALLALMPASLAGVTHLDWGRLGAGLLGLFLMTMSFGAAGLFISSLTREPTIAAVGSFGFLLLVWLLQIPAQQDVPYAELLQYLSLIGHFQNLLEGLFDSADVAYYLLFTALFLWLTVLRLDMERN